MKNGTRPIKRLPKKAFHELYGGIDVSSIQDFNLDAGLTMPDQDADSAYSECTGYTVADILTDIFKKAFSGDFSYAAGLHLDGVASSITGGDFHSSMQAAVMFGGQTQIAASIRASNVGELEVSEWTAWMSKDKAQALSNAQNGTLNALGLADAFDSIRNALAQGKISVSMGSPWYSEWESNTGADGIMPIPADTKNIVDLPWHNYKICGQKTINNTPYLIVKSWQGTKYGDGGYSYMSREVCDAVLDLIGTGALTFNPSASRWASALGIIAERFPMILPYLPELLQAGFTKI